MLIFIWRILVRWGSRCLLLMELPRSGIWAATSQGSRPGALKLKRANCLARASRTAVQCWKARVAGTGLSTTINGVEGIRKEKRMESRRTRFSSAADRGQINLLRIRRGADRHRCGLCAEVAQRIHGCEANLPISGLRQQQDRLRLPAGIDPGLRPAGQQAVEDAVAPQIRVAAFEPSDRNQDAVGDARAQPSGLGRGGV